MKNAPFLRENGAFVAPQVRFELTTLRLTAGCSTAELLRNIYYIINHIFNFIKCFKRFLQVWAWATKSEPPRAVLFCIEQKVIEFKIIILFSKIIVKQKVNNQNFFRLFQKTVPNKKRTAFLILQ